MVVARSRGPLQGRRRIGSTALSVIVGAPRPVLVVGPGSRWRSPIAVVYDGSAGADTALEFALESLPEGDRSLVVIVPEAGTDMSESDLANAARKRAAAEGVAIRVARVAALHSVLLSDAVIRARAGALVVHTALRFLDGRGLERLVAETTLPVAVVPAPDTSRASPPR
jgi:hypothetical protein